MELGNRIETLIGEVKAKMHPGMDDKVQEELGSLLVLLPYMRHASHSHMIGLAEVAAAALLADQPNLKVAEEIRERIRIDVRPSRTRFAAFMREGTPPTKVILGLGALLYFAIPFLTMYLPNYSESTVIFGIKADYLIALAVAGAIGSIVSIMVRIRDFSAEQDADPTVLFFTGLFKPVIGAAFALFIFAVLKSGIIPVTVNPETEQYFFLALSFIAGFSERFARDIASAAESRIAAAALTPPGAQETQQPAGKQQS